MKKNTYTIILDILNLIVSFLFCRWFFMRYLYSYYLSIVTYQITSSDFLGPLLVILILTFISFTCLTFIYRDKVNKKIIITLFILYFTALVYLLLLKNIGIRGFTFNPLIMINDIIKGDTFVPIMNVIMFIPLGVLLKGKKKLLFIALAGIVGIESIQYLFSLGIFDIADIIANFSGLIVGYGISETKLYKKILTKIN